MLKRNIRLRVVAAPLAIALAALVALPLVALAGTSDAIAQTGGMTATLPLLGSSLTVSVTLDSGGNVSQVNLDPVGTYTATKLSSHAVTFDSADGTTSVRIKAHGDSLSIKASAGSLDALVGPGTWSADVFGTGAASRVSYTIGKSGTAPTVTIDSVTAASGITTSTPAPGKHTFKDGAGASASVMFSANGYSKTLTISVRAADKSGKATLRLTLTGRDVQRLTGTLADLTGAHTWSGKACDGTAVAIAYTVNPDGTLTFNSATGGTATTKSSKWGLSVRFDGLKLRVRLALVQKQDGTYALLAGYHKSCMGAKVGFPTTNAPVAPGATQPGDHQNGKQGRGGHGGHGGGGRGFGGSH